MKKKKVFGTTEWAANNVNIISGCQHDCLYCYAKDMAIRFKRKTDGTWSSEIPNQKAIKKTWRKAKGTMMFPSTHDITPSNLQYAITVLRKLLESGNDVLIVSKPHLDVIVSLCSEFAAYKDQVMFRFSIGSTNSAALLTWEPKAPDFNDRKDSLIHAYNKGFKTSVSAEPMLDSNMDQLVDELSPYVTDSIWLGKMNRLFPRLKINGVTDPETIAKAHELTAMQSDANILKLYDQFKDNPLIKWKESIKKVVGLEIATEVGLDN